MISKHKKFKTFILTQIVDINVDFVRVQKNNVHES